MDKERFKLYLEKCFKQLKDGVSEASAKEILSDVVRTVVHNLDAANKYLESIPSPEAML